MEVLAYLSLLGEASVVSLGGTVLYGLNPSFVFM